MKFLRSVLRWILPEDKNDVCGYGPFNLGKDHPFTPACEIHDWEFKKSHNGTPDKPIDKVDWDLFYRWVLIVKAMPTDAERCKYAREICEYWPLARDFGPLLWDGDPKLN